MEAKKLLEKEKSAIEVVTEEHKKTYRKAMSELIAMHWHRMNSLC